jgi:transposase
MTLVFLPPYSPQLALIERVWKLARRLATTQQPLLRSAARDLRNRSRFRGMSTQLLGILKR